MRKYHEGDRQREQDGVRMLLLIFDFTDITSMFFEDVAARLETQISPGFASSDLFF